VANGVWGRLEAHNATVFQRDGDECLITPMGGEAHSVKVFWDAKSVDGGDFGGPQCWVATTDLPSPLPQGSNLRYPAYNGTDYTVATKVPDGHGLMLLMLVDEAEV
jgi:hypothetical protein